MRTNALMVLFTVSMLMVLFAGCGGGGNGAPPPGNGDPAPPQVTQASVEPQELYFTGGEVTITADVQSERTIQQVRATVNGPEEPQTVNLNLNGQQYEGTFAAPANTAATAATYTVTVTATNTSGRSSASFNAGAFTVESSTALDSPPGLPPDW